MIEGWGNSDFSLMNGGGGGDNISPSSLGIIFMTACVLSLQPSMC